MIQSIQPGTFSTTSYSTEQYVRYLQQRMIQAISSSDRSLSGTHPIAPFPASDSASCLQPRLTCLEVSFSRRMGEQR
jgi:hypothetical protein